MIPHGARTGCRAASHLRRHLIHSSSSQHALTKFAMPAMSPTMTEGGIAQWKKAEGESFTAGDVLLEIETDKATIDVEAQDDGIVGKIIAPNGSKNIPVGKIIALLAQEGDDISNLEVPKDETPPPPPKETQKSSTSSQAASSNTTSASAPPSSSPIHIETDRPLFPSVQRLLKENHMSGLEQIKGTGIRGMITKGDFLTFLGKASGPNGTFKDDTPTPSVYKSRAAVSKGPLVATKAPLDAAGIRQTILNSFLADSLRRRVPFPTHASPTADSVIADYLPAAVTPKVVNPNPVVKTTSSDNYLEGLY